MSWWVGLLKIAIYFFVLVREVKECYKIYFFYFLTDFIIKGDDTLLSRYG